ncbi:hypothetical protein ACTJJ4_07135 [Microbacterium sp. 22195]|uniref:hypothetical protein n=1 Tax=Microbacterium sp. 22195 TaxID=3453891 RepID=UPI003F86F6AF
MTATALAFVTSLRHPHNSRDYRAVEEQFAAGLASWMRQTSPRFAVIVVANRRPPLADDPRIRFVQVDFPPPSNVAGPRTGLAAVVRDKGTKLAVGLAAARDAGARHVMFVDDDDFVSNRLAAFVAQHPDAAGWTFTDGWRINVERRALRAHHGDFHLQCGSSHIVRTDLLPEVPAGAPTQEQLYAALGDRLERWLGSHMHIHDDIELAPLPFPGALYRVGQAEAHSGNSLSGWSRPVSASVAREFGVPATGLAPWSLARAVLPSARAVRERLRRR